MRRLSLTAVALAALVAAGCDGGRVTPESASSSSVGAPTPRSVDVVAPTRMPTPQTTPTVQPPDGTDVLAGPTRGAGPGHVATLRVPRRFAVVVSCAGTGRFVIVVDGRGRLPTRCGPHSDEFVYEPLGEPGRVTVRIETTYSVRWAVLVTTATR